MQYWGNTTNRNIIVISVREDFKTFSEDLLSPKNLGIEILVQLMHFSS